MPSKVRYSKKIAKFICSKIEDGMTIKAIAQEYAGKVPHEKSIWRWRTRYPDFKTLIDSALQTKFWMTNDKIGELTNKPLPTPDELAKKYNTDDKTLIKAYLAAELKQRRDVFDKYRLDLSKLAPKMFPEFSDKVQIEHKGNVGGPQIVIQSYAVPDQAVINITPNPLELDKPKGEK